MNDTKPNTHWSFHHDATCAWLDEMEHLLRDLSWAYIPTNACTGKNKPFKQQEQEIDKVETIIKGFLRASIAIGFLDSDDVRNVRAIVRNVGFRQPLEVCVQDMRLVFTYIPQNRVVEK